MEMDVARAKALVAAVEAHRMVAAQGAADR